MGSQRYFIDRHSLGVTNIDFLRLDRSLFSFPDPAAAISGTLAPLSPLSCAFRGGLLSVPDSDRSSCCSKLDEREICDAPVHP
jgi:hypothetical protein